MKFKIFPVHMTNSNWAFGVDLWHQPKDVFVAKRDWQINIHFGKHSFGLSGMTVSEV